MDKCNDIRSGENYDSNRGNNGDSNVDAVVIISVKYV